MEYDVVESVNVMHSSLPEVTVGFDPTAYTVTEGVDGSVTLRVVKTGSAAIPVTAVVTTQPGSAGGLG